jgi:hypothetical protein
VPVLLAFIAIFKLTLSRTVGLGRRNMTDTENNMMNNSIQVPKQTVLTDWVV